MIFLFNSPDIYLPFSFIFLLFLLNINFIKVEENKKARIIFYLLFLIILTFIIYSSLLTFLQYKEWKEHPISKYLLPPYQNINYFLTYSLFRYFRDFYFRLIGVFLTFMIIFFINFVLKRDVFYEDEKFILPAISLLFAFPYNLLFIILGFFVLLLIIMINVLFNKELINEYFSLRNIWILLAMGFFISQFLFFNNYLYWKYRP